MPANADSTATPAETQRAEAALSGDVAGGGGGDDEQGGDQEDPDGVDRRSHHEGDDQRERTGRPERGPPSSWRTPRGSPAAGSGCRAGRGTRKRAGRGRPSTEARRRPRARRGVAVQEGLKVPRQPLLPADDRDPEGDDGREEDADDRVRREFGASLDQGDGDGDEDAERDHRPGGGDAEEHAEGHAGEGGVADRVGEEGHPVLDKRDAERGGGGGREEQREERALHERRFREREREQPVHQAEHARRG